jgi:hypothetical protein
MIISAFAISGICCGEISQSCGSTPKGITEVTMVLFPPISLAIS